MVSGYHLTRKPKPFVSLELPVKSWVENQEMSFKYRIYKEDGECVMVEAENAAQAVASSGVLNPVRIAKGAYDPSPIVDSARLLAEDAQCVPQDAEMANMEQHSAP